MSAVNDNERKELKRLEFQPWKGLMLPKYNIFLTKEIIQYNLSSKNLIT